MTMNRKFATLAAAAGLGAGALLVVPALATSPRDFVPTSLALGHFSDINILPSVKTGSWDLLMRTKGATDVGVDRVDIKGGGYSGWHSHYGPVLVTIKTGTIEYFDGDNCAMTTLTAGQTHVEPANHAHYVRNASPVNEASFVAVQIRPKGTPGKQDQPVPQGCENVH